MRKLKDGAAYWIHYLRFLLDNLVSLSELKIH